MERPDRGQHGPADQRTVRRHNMGLVIAAIARGGPRSRARISSETGLNPSTVSSLTAELIESGMVVEAGTEQSGAIGRPGRYVDLNPDGGLAIGLEISDDGIGVLALDLAGRPRYRAFISQPNEKRDPEIVLGQLAKLAREALQTLNGSSVGAVCTMALPGLIGEEGVLLEAPNLDWHEVPVESLWRKLMNVEPLALENEARLAAYAEMTEGVARDLSSFAFVSGGTGLGSGLVINRRIFRGAHGFAGEFGHIVIERNGPASGWGARGTVQTLAGERALARLAHVQRSDDGGRSDPDWIGRQLARLASEGQCQALSAITEVGHNLGVGLATLLNLFDMEAIVLGGYLTHLATWLRPSIDEEIRDRVLSQKWKPTPILFSDMGRGAALRGAAVRSLDLILYRAGSGFGSPTSAF